MANTGTRQYSWVERDGVDVCVCAVYVCLLEKIIAAGQKYTSSPFLYLLCTTTWLFQTGEGTGEAAC